MGIYIHTHTHTHIYIYIYPFSPPVYISWELVLIRCEVKGQGCLCVQIVKPSEDNS